MTDTVIELAQHPRRQAEKWLDAFPETESWTIQLPRDDSALLGQVPVVAWAIDGYGAIKAIVAHQGAGLSEDFLPQPRHYVGPAGQTTSNPPKTAAAVLGLKRQWTLTSPLPELHGHMALLRDGHLLPISGWLITDGDRLEPLFRPMDEQLQRPTRRQEKVSERADYCGLLTAEQAEQIALGGPIESRFIGLLPDVW